MKWLLLIFVFGKCPAQTTIEYQTLAACQAAQTKLEADWTNRHVDASATCIKG